jgi:hypothetical protein
MTVALAGVPTDKSATVRLTPEDSAFLDAAIPEWVAAVDWEARARYVEESLVNYRHLHGKVDAEQAVGLSLRITALLEQLGSTALESIDQAWLFRLTAHPQWRAAAARWLRYAGEKRSTKWIRAHPATFVVADGCRQFWEPAA